MESPDSGVMTRASGARSLRSRILLWFIALHLVLAVFAVVLLIERPILLFAVEALFVISIVISVRLVRSLFLPLEMMRTGAELIAERDFSSRFTPTGLEEFDALAGVYNEMIETLRKERLASEEQHHLLQKIVDASPAGVVLCSFDGTIERMNPAAAALMTDALRAELDAVEPGTSRLVTSGMGRLRISRTTFRDRGFEKSFCLIEELTQELRASEKQAYEKLIRMMSHEVNNSVGAVRSLLESALRYAPQVGDADRRDFTNALTIASERVDSLNRFMAAFAAVVRIPPPRLARTAVAPLVERIVSLLSAEAAQKRIDIRLTVSDRGEYDVDAVQLEQVVLNVLRNAIEAAGEGGSVDVSFATGSLSVRDSGSGIAESVRGELFTPFFTTKRDGCGLGLTIVREILTNHGLPFALENSPAGGAEFRIRFG